MTDTNEHFRRVRADAEADAFLKSYQNISPHIQFASGNDAITSRLIAFEDLHEDLQITTNYEAVVAGGWSALELGASMPPSVARTTMIDRAHARFERAAVEGAASDNMADRLMGYVGRLGTVAAYAYQDESPRQTIEDSPGLYSALLDDIMDDHELRDRDPSSRSGLMAEVTIATLLGYMQHLVLPASFRHDRPMTIEEPSIAHDLQLWVKPPKALPARPDHRIQVKVGSKGSGGYAKSITELVMHELFEDHDRVKLPGSLTSFYDGGRGKDRKDIGRERIRRCARAIRPIIKQVSESDAAIDFALDKSAAMRGSGNMRQTALHVQ